MILYYGQTSPQRRPCQALVTVSVAISYNKFFACLKCLHSWALSTPLEVVKAKIRDKKSGTCKVLGAFVSCIIFISLTGYIDRPALILCYRICHSFPHPPCSHSHKQILKKPTACSPSAMVCVYVSSYLCCAVHICCTCVANLYVQKQPSAQ